ncbi:hypothetical protein ACFLUJ_02790, partial [Chloroflexota bacterium]
MELDTTSRQLLNSIFSATLESPDGVEALRIRADNEQLLSEIDQLESLGFIERKKNRYFIKLLALIQLAEENREAQIMLLNCSRVFDLLRVEYKKNPGDNVMSRDISKITGFSQDAIGTVLNILIQTSVLGGYSGNHASENAWVAPSERILRYQSFEDILQETQEQTKLNNNKYQESKQNTRVITKIPVEQKISSSTSKTTWKAIENEFGVTKNSFGRKFNFVSDEFRRKIIFRDVEHAFVLASSGFSKPAVILAGSVIEELLRLYLISKGIKPVNDTFDEYIKACESNGLLKSAISRLSHSVREFRNLVHLSAEKTRSYTVPKATAKGAVSSIF